MKPNMTNRFTINLGNILLVGEYHFLEDGCFQRSDIMLNLSFSTKQIRHINFGSYSSQRICVHILRNSVYSSYMCVVITALNDYAALGF